MIFANARGDHVVRAPRCGRLLRLSLLLQAFRSPGHPCCSAAKPALRRFVNGTSDPSASNVDASDGVPALAQSIVMVVSRA
jgi:hypothetical protein